jgi:uncharacterized RDD family membrane protein YckC
MSGSCPKCGFEPVDKAECPRCGTMVAFYREAMLSRLETLPPGVVVGPPSASPRPVELAAGRAAGFWIRGVAVFIDGLFLLAAGFAVEVLIHAIFGEAADDSAVLRAANRAFEVVFGALYGILFHWLWGQTFGKMAMRIRVVMLDGTPLALGVSALRYLGSLVSALLFGIGYLMAGIRADKRALHDLIAGTRVEHVG